ncbi:hypothetical protein MHBO_002976, partial [Bonamia ostreae]
MCFFNFLFLINGVLSICKLPTDSKIYVAHSFKDSGFQNGDFVDFGINCLVPEQPSLNKVFINTPIRMYCNNNKFGIHDKNNSFFSTDDFECSFSVLYFIALFMEIFCGVTTIICLFVLFIFRRHSKREHYAQTEGKYAIKPDVVLDINDE